MKNISGLGCEWLQETGADVWLLSPPCQPYTSKGRQLQLSDPRAATIRWLAGAIREVRPEGLLLENVPPFRESDSGVLLRETLAACGYFVREESICPSVLGIPNRRLRYYLLASLRGPVPPPDLSPLNPAPAFSDYLDPVPAGELYLEEAFLARYQHAVDRVPLAERGRPTACFASAYGRQALRSGSYLEDADGRWRRFSPQEVLRLLHFPRGFGFPPGLSTRRCWDLAGASVNVEVCRRLIGAVVQSITL